MLEGATEGSGPPALLLNGLYCSTHYFVTLAPLLGARLTTTVFDYRGHGRSGDPTHPAGVGLPELLLDAAAVLDHVAPSAPAVLIGHSLGVRVALELAALRPERVAALVLLCGSGWGAFGPRLTPPPLVGALEPALRLAARSPRAVLAVRRFVLRSGLVPSVGRLLGGFSPASPPASIADLLASVDRLPPASTVSLLRSYLLHDSRPLLGRVAAPTQVIAGALDRLAPPEHARVLARTIAGAEVAIVAGASHLAPVEFPDRVAALTLDFLARRGPLRPLA
jgi:pimeloyl-ACP methyl ester carboxylesterase